MGKRHTLKTLSKTTSSKDWVFPDMMNLFKNWCLRRTPHELELNHLKLRVAPDVKASLHPDGVVLIHLGRGTVFSANRVGAMIWNGAAERWSIEKVAESISTEFHIAPATVQQDAAEFLAQLAAEGLLVPDAT
jgi:hypothetical protein